MSPLPARRRSLLSAAAGFAVLLGLVLACYFPVLRGTPVWDDPSHLTRPGLEDGHGLFRIWFELGATEQYYPVLHSAFWLEHHLWGDAVLGYHLLNALLHAVGCGLFALALRRLGDGKSPRQLPPFAPFLAAVLFAVHPVMVESVAWIAEQKNTLSLVFYLSAGLAYWRFHRARQASAYVLAAGLFLLALGTKSVTSSLPAALLVVIWWQEGRLRARADVLPLLPWFAAAAAMGFTTAWVEHSLIGASGAPFDYSLLQRLLLAGRVLWFYLGKLVWPRHLVFFYPRWNVAGEASGWYGYLAAAVLLTGGLFWLRRRARGPLAAWLFYVGTLFPALGFVNVYPFLFSYVADHFQYLASLGLFAAAGTGLGQLMDPRKRGAGLGALAMVGVVTGLVVAARQQSAEYRDGATLYRAIVAGNPNGWKGHELLGETLLGQPGRAAEAQRELEAAVALNPADGEALNDLGSILMNAPGQEAEAERFLARAADAAPYLPEPHLNLARLLERVPGRQAEAAAQYRSALRLSPRNEAAHFGLANLLAQRPATAGEAEAEFDATLRLDPANVGAAVNRAVLLAREPGRADAAIAAYRAVLRDHPELAPVHFNLGMALAAQPGHGAEAVAEYRATLRIDPGFAGAHRNLGIEYARAGRMDLAEAEWRQAVALEPRYTDLKAKLDELDRGR